MLAHIQNLTDFRFVVRIWTVQNSPGGEGEGTRPESANTGNGHRSASRPRPRAERQLFGEDPMFGGSSSTTTHLPHNNMSDKPTAPPAENAASAAAENVASKAAAAPKALPEQNAAFRMMGRLIARSTSTETQKMRRSYSKTNNSIAQASLASASRLATG